MLLNSRVDEMIVNEIVAKELVIAADNYKAAEAELKDAEFKYHKLVKFRQDYVERFDREMKDYVSEETQQGFRSFFSRLEMIVFEQQDIIAELKKKMKIKHQLAQECKRKCQLAVEKEPTH